MNGERERRRVGREVAGVEDTPPFTFCVLSCFICLLHPLFFLFSTSHVALSRSFCISSSLHWCRFIHPGHPFPQSLSVLSRSSPLASTVNSVLCRPVTRRRRMKRRSDVEVWCPSVLFCCVDSGSLEGVHGRRQQTRQEAVVKHASFFFWWLPDFSTPPDNCILFLTTGRRDAYTPMFSFLLGVRWF